MTSASTGFVAVESAVLRQTVRGW